MRIKALAALLVLMPVAVFGQGFDFGGGQTDSRPAWKQGFNLDPKKRIKLNFQNSSVDAIVTYFSKASGITIVKDPALTGTLTVTSAKPVSLGEAFQILSTTLSLKNFGLEKEGNLLVIRNRNQNRGGGQNRGGSGFGGLTPQQIAEMMQGGNQQAPAIVRVYQIQYANASQVARVVNEVFATNAQQNNQGFNPFMFGGGGGNQGRGGNNRGGFNPNMFRMGQQGGSTVRASSDDFSNSVVVNAPERDQQQVQDLIRQLDKQTEQPQQSKVFRLEYASSDELAPVVQNVLTSNAPRGRGGIGSQNVPFEQRIQQAARFGSTQAAFGTVVSDPRTNSLVVTGTQENLDLVAKVIEELDTEVEIENTTFVFPLENARADDIAGLLQQAFGSRQGTGQQRNVGNNQNRNNQNRNNTQNRNNQNRNLGGGGGGRAQTNNQEEDPNNLYLELEDPNADSGLLATTVGVAQQGFQFFPGNQRRQTGTTQTARDAQGRLINVRDLTNQVTIIADPNTNSLIVVTTPENADLIRQVLGQLDKIPEQVMIETMIVEATLDSSTKLGVEWRFAQDRPFLTPGTTGTAETGFGLGRTDQGFRYTLGGGALTAFVNALQSDDRFQVLSTPRIFTSNNVQAEINISQRVPYVVSSREDVNGNLTFTYDFEDVGIVLTVTPRITSNGMVTMDVSQTANDLQGFTDFNAPIVNQRQADTTVSVRDGETIILGGIIRSAVTSRVRKVPLLGDIPLLGNLFRSTEKSNVKTELLVFLTPRVVRDPEEMQKLREQQEKSMSKQSQDAINKANKNSGLGNQNQGGGTGPDDKKVPPPVKGGG